MGNMNGAILRGVLAAKTATPDQIVFSRPNEEAGQQLAADLGVGYIRSNLDLVSGLNDDVVIIGVKPHLIAGVLQEIAPAAAGKVIVSVAAGITLAALEANLPEATAIVRAMPNVNAQIRAGMTALAPNAHVSAEQFAKVAEVFQAVGEITQIPEANFAAFSAIAGASPAWTYTYIDALARGALASGMKLADARKAAAQAVAGSAQLVLQKLDELPPASLRDQVTSPGGTTIAGLIAMEEAGFSSAVVKGVKAAIERDAELGK